MIMQCQERCLGFSHGHVVYGDALLVRITSNGLEAPGQSEGGSGFFNRTGHEQQQHNFLEESNMTDLISAAQGALGRVSNSVNAAAGVKPPTPSAPTDQVPEVWRYIYWAQTNASGGDKLERLWSAAGILKAERNRRADGKPVNCANK